jgi:hypothetical protein
MQEALICGAQHTSAYVSIRQHTSAYVGVSPVATAGLCKRLLSAAHHLARLLTKCAPKLSQQVRCTALPVAQHASACVSIRQHTLAIARKLWQQERCTALLAAAPLRQHLYSCARKASKLSTCFSDFTNSARLWFAPIAQHTSAYVSIRQHTSAYSSLRSTCTHTEP